MNRRSTAAPNNTHHTTSNNGTYLDKQNSHTNSGNGNLQHQQPPKRRSSRPRSGPSSRNGPRGLSSSRPAQPKQCPLHYFIMKCGIATIFLFWIMVAYFEIGNTTTKTQPSSSSSSASNNLRSGTKSDIQNKMHQMADAAFESAQLAFHEAQKEAKVLAEAAKEREQQLLSKLDKHHKKANGDGMDILPMDSVLKNGISANDSGDATPLVYEPPWEHDTIERPGFVVLGMHRSGTSMLSGLLVTGFGYKTGGPLIGPAFDNAKGFFERVDIVLQNDVFMWSQKIDWANNVISYDGDMAYEEYKQGNIKFEQHGKPGLEFLNDVANRPWLQKDPRMCITLKTWIPLITPSPPAVVFTYRHPLEVAMSLKKREKSFPLERGLRLWIVYNMRAIQNAKGLCIVYSSNERILESTLQEVQRISDELTSKCNVLSPPTKILTQERVDVFVDPTLRHNKKTTANDSELEEGQILERHGDCVVPKYDTDDHTNANPRELELYKKAMKIYCDLKTGDAYREDYAWPTLS